MWVREFPDGEPVRVSSGGGVHPVWSRDSTELYFHQGRALMAAALDAGADLRLEQPTVLFEGDYFILPPSAPSYAVGADGRSLMIEPPDPGDVRERINVVLNWFEELKQRVPTGR